MAVTLLACSWAGGLASWLNELVRSLLAGGLLACCTLLASWLVGGLAGMEDG